MLNMNLQFFAHKKLETFYTDSVEQRLIRALM